jgi:sugar porter (SP) family MFS transporter
MYVENRYSHYYTFGIACVSALAGLLFGFDLVVISGALEFIVKTFCLDSDQIFFREIIVSSVPAGALIGAIFSNYSSQKIGRKNSIIITAILFFIGTLIVTITPILSGIIIGRLLMGFAVGLSATVVPMYLSEISSPKRRGMTVFLYQFAITVGILFGFLDNYVFHESGNWRYMFALGLVPSALLGFGMIPLPESPRWLLTKGKRTMAQKALQELRGKDNVEKEIKEIESTTHHQDGGIQLLFSKRIRPLVFISFGLFVFQQLTGINTIFYYAPQIFREAGFIANASSASASVATGGVFVFATTIGILLVDKVGRRKLLLIGTLGITICQFIQGAALLNILNCELSLISALIAISFYAFSITGIAYLIMSEIFPLNIRTMGMAVASCANWGVNMIIAASFLSLANALGMGLTFWLYGVLTFIGFVFIYFFVPETKGRTLEEIEANLYSGVPVRYLGKKITSS